MNRKFVLSCCGLEELTARKQVALGSGNMQVQTPIIVQRVNCDIVIFY